MTPPPTPTPISAVPRFSRSIPPELDAWLDEMAEQARQLSERFQRDPSELVAPRHRMIGGPLDSVHDARGDERVALTRRGTLLLSSEAADRLTAALSDSATLHAGELTWLRETSRRVLAAQVALVGPRTHVLPPDREDVLGREGLPSADAALDDGVRDAWSADHVDEALHASGTDRRIPGIVPERPVRPPESSRATAARAFGSALAARTGQTGADELTRLAQSLPDHRFDEAAHRLLVVRGLTNRLSDRQLGRAQRHVAATLRDGFAQACRLPAGPFAGHRIRAAAARTVTVAVREADRIRRTGHAPRPAEAPARDAVRHSPSGVSAPTARRRGGAVPRSSVRER